MIAVEDVKNTALISAFAQRWRLLRITSVQALVDTIEVVDHLVRLSNKVLPVKSYFNAAQDLQRQTPGAHVCIEDEFVVACAYLDVVISKSGSIYYLDGEAPDLRETKLKRTPIKLDDEVTLKAVSGIVARPDDTRGKIERDQTVSGVNHLARLLRLQSLMYKAVEIHSQASDNRKINVRRQFDLTDTDYELMMSMARRAGLTTLRNRARDPRNNFTLRTELFAKVSDRAGALGISPQKALNLLVEDFFKILEVKDRQKQLAPKKKG